MEQLKTFLDDSGILSYLNNRGQNAAPVYLVGGALRDNLLGVICSDFDFITSEDPTACAKGLAHIFSGTWFMLDQTRNQSRVVMSIDGKRIICDFAPFRAPTLEEDLRNRDFTINALAWPCSSPSITGHIYDPLGGINDLENKCLRICCDLSFQEDPLRTLKCIRHATCMHLEIEDETFALLKEAVANTDQVAPERIRAELARILAEDDVTTGIRLLSEAGLMSELFGNPLQSDGVLLAIERLDHLQKLIFDIRTNFSLEIQSILDKDVEEFLPFSGIVKFATFCRAYRPIAPVNVLRALRFSKQTVNFISETQALSRNDCLFELATLPKVTRAQARWVANLGHEPIGILLVLMAEMLALKSDMIRIDGLADSFFEHAIDGKLPDLVDGNWLRKNFQIKAGPVVGRLMKLVEIAELKGEVSTTQDARKWLNDNQKTVDNILLEHL
jgi:poly(A) polymerase